MRHSGTVLGSALLGARLRNTAGQDLGRIEEFVVNPRTGDIRYVVVSSDIIGDRLLAIPWSAVTVPPAQDYLLVEASKELLERAPAFERAQWPDMNDMAWTKRSRDYWEKEPTSPVSPAERIGVERTTPRRSISGLGAALAILVLLGLVGLTYLVTTRGWETAKNDIVDSAQTVAYAMKETSEDATLTTKVKTALSLSKRVPGWSINVDSNDGVVSLRGEVHDADVKVLAEEIARDTNGVKAVQNELSVNPRVAAEADSQEMRNRVAELEMRYQVRDSLVKEPQLRQEDIEVEVANQTVTLKGTVTTSDQKYLAEQIARKTSGAQTVNNRLEVIQPQ